MTTVVRAPDAITRRVATTVVVLGGRSDEPLLLSATGVAVWDALAEQVTRDDLVAGLAARFGASADVVGADVDAFLRDLVAAGAVVRR